MHFTILVIVIVMLQVPTINSSMKVYGTSKQFRNSFAEFWGLGQKLRAEMGSQKTRISPKRFKIGCFKAIGMLCMLMLVFV